MSRLAIFIASRYLFSKKSTNAINVISAISMVGIFFGTMALIIVLSTFNGFEGVISSLINSFDAEIKIEPSVGKTLNPKEIELEFPWINEVIPVLEENVVITNGETQEIGTIKGVGKSFWEQEVKDSLLVLGSFNLDENKGYSAVFGRGLASRLNVNPGYSQEPVTFFTPNRDTEFNPLNPQSSLNTISARPVGVFTVHDEIDDHYVIIPIKIARKLLNEPENISHFELTISSSIEQEEAQELIQQKLGNGVKVSTRKQQNELIYKVFKSEKWSTFAILTFILLIAAFNIIGSLSMLVLEKKEDIVVMKSMGASNTLIQRIFMFEGMMIAWIGGIGGLAVGLSVCWAQITFGFVSMDNSIIESYPIVISLSDVALVFVTVLILGWLCAFYPARNASKMESVNAY